MLNLGDAWIFDEIDKKYTVSNFISIKEWQDTQLLQSSLIIRDEPILPAKFLEK